MEINVLDIVSESLIGFFNNLSASLPNIIGALLILIIGWVLAKVIKWAAKKLLKVTRFDNLADRLGVGSFLAKGGFKSSASGILASLVYWTIMLAVLNAVFNKLGLEVVSEMLNRIILFIPKIIVACILLVIGMYLADFVKNLVIGSLKGGNMMPSKANRFGTYAYGGVMFFVFCFALTFLGIGTEIIITVVQMVLGGLALGVALAFGLGGKDWAKGIVEKYFPK